MNWLKCTPVFKHGYGSPIYTWLSDETLASEALVEDVKHHLRNEHGDPEGLREPQWEMVEVPPKDVLEYRIQSDVNRLKYIEQRLARNRQILEKHYD